MNTYPLELPFFDAVYYLYSILSICNLPLLKQSGLVERYNTLQKVFRQR